MTSSAAWPTRRRLVAVWVGAALGFGVLLAAAERAEGPLDDPNPARQRPGLVDLGALPLPAPEVITGVPRPGRRAVVFFTRPVGLASLCRAVTDSGLPQKADLAIVVSGDAGQCSRDVAVVVDTTATRAQRFGLPTPRDGGPPVGYAIVDSRQRIRYLTLDPEVTRGLDEISTLLRAVR